MTDRERHVTTKPGRIPCINPRCRRTAPTERHPDQEIICGKCFRALPAAVRERRKQLERRIKFIERRWARRIMHGQAAPGSQAPTRTATIAMLDQWKQIKASFAAPDKPVGLEGFLKEIGL